MQFSSLVPKGNVVAVASRLKMSGILRWALIPPWGKISNNFFKRKIQFNLFLKKTNTPISVAIGGFEIGTWSATFVLT